MEPAQKSINDLVNEVTKVCEGYQRGMVYSVFAGVIGMQAASAKLSAKDYASLKLWFNESIDSAYESYYQQKRKEAGIDD